MKDDDPIRSSTIIIADILVDENIRSQYFDISTGEGEVTFFSAKRWDRRNRADLIESATPCHDAQVVGLYRDSNPLRLTILAAMSEDYTTAPQHLHSIRYQNITFLSLHNCRTFQVVYLDRPPFPRNKGIF